MRTRARIRKPRKSTGSYAPTVLSSTPSAGQYRNIFQLEAPLEDPLDRAAKRTKHVSKEGKVVSIAIGSFVISSNIRSF